MSVIYYGKSYKVKKKRGLLTLNLSYKKINYISDIEGLENLTDLQVLKLNDNSILNTVGLESLRNLVILDLSYNQITEIKNLENLVNLKELHLEGNKITEIKGLDTLTKLEKVTLMSLVRQKKSDIDVFSKKKKKEENSDPELCCCLIFLGLIGFISLFLFSVGGSDAVQQFMEFLQNLFNPFHP